MKRKLIFGVAFLFVVWAATSCEALQTCKVCKQVTYTDGSVTDSTDPQEYCDADLIKIEATPDFKLGNTVTKWECN